LQNANSALGVPLMTARQVADWLNISPATVLDWYEAGRLPGFKLGRAVRFDRAALEAWLSEQKRAA